MAIELRDREGAQTVVQALDAYKARLRAGIVRTKQRLAAFESRYGVDTGAGLNHGSCMRIITRTRTTI